MSESALPDSDSNTVADDNFVDAYRAPWWLRNGHAQSIWPSLFRQVAMREPVVESIPTPDDDELWLDWYQQGASRLAVICHGLEGHSRRPYVLGLARALLSDGWDVLAWNYRSCGGVMNHQPRFYHSGATDDLGVVVDHGLAQGYRAMALAGFSMGGNLTLQYLGEQGEAVDSRIAGAVTFSVPCDLAGGADVLARPSRRLYMSRFITDLRAKMAEKARRFPDRISMDGFDDIRRFHEFDERYTAPLHGFEGARDYWHRASSLFRLRHIRVPALMVNAVDDPFLSRDCFPDSRELLGPWTTLEAPRHGGHVGFVQRHRDGWYWSDERAVDFLRRTAH
ncbi:YheT family hydrolase [Marinobacter sp. OP 3.4]|uniref:YheT family hydrolase n=1 Tax=Marinobacter sp. OP 3.4 TaxID=3076501 RepID=UPI002E206D38